MIAQHKTQEVVRLLVNDALEATDGSHAEATVLLNEAVMTLILNRHQGAAAIEIAMMFAGGMVNYVKSVSGFADFAPAEVFVSEDPDVVAATDMQASERLGVFLAGGTPFDNEGDLTVAGRDLGSREDWEFSAHSYCMASLYNKQGGTKGGMASLSAAGVGLLLGLTERWGVAAGAMLPPGLAEMAERGDDEKASAHAINLLEIAIEHSRRRPAEAVLLLADAINLILLKHFEPAPAQKMARAIGEFVVNATDAMSGRGAARQ